MGASPPWPVAGVDHHDQTKRDQTRPDPYKSLEELTVEVADCVRFRVMGT